MVEKAASEYAKIFRSLNFEREIKPIHDNIDEMMKRLNEFEALVLNVQAETGSIMENRIRPINQFHSEFKTLRERIDQLEAIVDTVEASVDNVERAVDIAEEELRVTDYSLKGLLLKPLLNKTNKAASEQNNIARSNLKDGIYQPVPTFKSTDFFEPTNGQTRHTNSQGIMETSTNEEEPNASS